MHENPCSCYIKSYHNRIYVWISKEDKFIHFDNIADAFTFAHSFMRDCVHEVAFANVSICKVMKDIIKNEYPPDFVWTIIQSATYKIKIGLGTPVKQEDELISQLSRLMGACNLTAIS